MGMYALYRNTNSTIGHEYQALLQKRYHFLCCIAAQMKSSIREADRLFLAQMNQSQDASSRC